jgi:acyl-CoA thioesterase-1
MAHYLLFFRKINPDMFKLYVVIGFFLASFLTGVSEDRSLEDPKVILCFGNSITAGHGLNPELAYPSLLEQILRKKGYNYRVINAGLSGETSAGGLTRIDWILRNKVDIFILELGANDGLRGLPLMQTRSNLSSIIKKVLKKYPETQIVIAGMMVPPNMGHDYSAEFIQLYSQLASEYDALLIPFLLDGVGGIPELNLSDGIHPNAEGHKIVAENVFEVIKGIL